MKIIDRLSIITFISVFICFLMVLGSIGTGRVYAFGNTCTWTNQGGDHKFSTAANWTNCNAGIPGNEDNLFFDTNSIVAAPGQLENDIDGLIVNTITIVGVVTDPAVKIGTAIGGKEIIVNSGIHLSQYSTEIDYLNINLFFPLTLGGDVSFTSDNAQLLHIGNNLNLNGHNVTQNVNHGLIRGSIVGTGNIRAYKSTVIGDAAGPKNCSYNNSCTPAVNTWMGDLYIGAASYGLIYPGSMGNAGSIYIENGGMLVPVSFNGQTLAQNISMGGETAIFTSGSCQTESCHEHENPDQSIFLSGGITLRSASSVSTDGVITITGPIYGNYLLNFYDEQYPLRYLAICSSDNQSQTPNNNRCGDPDPTPAPTSPPTTSGDSGFRPNIHGFGFNNFGASILSFSSFEQFFGSENTRTDNGEVRLSVMRFYDTYYGYPSNIIPLKTSSDYKYIGFKGNCFGFSGASVVNYKKLDQTSVGSFFILGRNGYFDVESVGYYTDIGLPQYDLVTSLGYFQGVQLGAEADQILSQSAKKTALHNLNTIQDSILQGMPIQVSVTRWRQKNDAVSNYLEEVGHSLLAYRYAASGDQVEVYVYDSNYPGEEKKVIFDTQKNTWVYDPLNGVYVYSPGRPNYGTLSIFPSEGYVRKGVLPISVNTSENTVITSPDSITLVTDSFGHQLGQKDGEVFDEIQEAAILPMIADSDIGSGQKFLLPGDKNFLIKTTSLNEAQGPINIFGKGSLISVKDINPIIHETNSIQLDNHGKAITLSTDSPVNSSYYVTLDQEMEKRSHSFTVKDLSLIDGESISFELIKETGKLKITNHGVDKNYVMTIQETGGSDSIITLQNMSIKNNMTHIWTPADWDNLTGNSINVAVDNTSDGIIDTTIIANSVTINNGEEITNTRNVLLHLVSPTAHDQMRIANESFGLTDKLPKWQEYTPDLEWALSKGNGLKTVYVQFKTGSLISGIYLGSVILDNKKPVVSDLVINNGQRSTNNPQVRIQINATDNLSGIQNMKVSNLKDLSTESWKPYQAEFSWNLLPLPSNKSHLRKVYIQLKDTSGNVSRIFKGNILLSSNL